MSVRIHYELNGGKFSPKDEVKEAFFTDLYHFINERYDTELKQISLRDFIHAEPYIIGNLASKYYLEEVIGGKLEDQSEDYFIGYCYKNGKYVDLIHRLIVFFADWRRIEGCLEPHAEDFFASSWAALVDTAKYFKYTTVDDLKKSPEAPSLQCDTILNHLQNCPGVYEPPIEVNHHEKQRLARPVRKGYYFYGWYDNPEFHGEPIKYVDSDATSDLTYYARWETYTYFHSNDGYITFDELYDDFLKDFSTVVGKPVGKSFERHPEHGRVSEFVRESYGGKLNEFFSIPTYHDKWWWLIEYFRTLKKDEEERAKFEFKDGQFGSEPQVRWELNSLFVGWFHLTWPKTGDYSGPGIKEGLVNSTNSKILKVEYLVGETVELPVFTRRGYRFVGWYDNPKGVGDPITQIVDDCYASRTLYAQWEKISD